MSLKYRYYFFKIICHCSPIKRIYYRRWHIRLLNLNAIRSCACRAFTVLHRLLTTWVFVHWFPNLWKVASFIKEQLCRWKFFIALTVRKFFLFPSGPGWENGQRKFWTFYDLALLRLRMVKKALKELQLLFCGEICIRRCSNKYNYFIFER